MWARRRGLIRALNAHSGVLHGCDRSLRIVIEWLSAGDNRASKKEVLDRASSDGIASSDQSFARETAVPLWPTPSRPEPSSIAKLMTTTAAKRVSTTTNRIEGSGM